jgi:DNA-3-methyladenine glycosylase I
VPSRLPHGILRGPDGAPRCFWGLGAPELLPYHDHEWGLPVVDDHRLFEKICLEGFQSGLSWLTILRKREAFRRAFAGFDFGKVARFGPAKVQRLLGDAGIVRHRGKIQATIDNARRACELADEVGSLAAYFWRFEPTAKSRPARLTKRALAGLTTSPEATALSKALKARGWSFVGPTTVYAFMQGMGLVDDHLEGCFARTAVEDARARFRRP